MQGGVEEGLLGPGEDGEAATVLPASAEQQDLLATCQHAQYRRLTRRFYL